MKVEEIELSELKPYENNPRNNKRAVQYVANSIRDFGVSKPIVIDADNVIVCGHTRYEAAKRLGMKSFPCVRADDLTPEQVRAFRLVDNKSAEYARWDPAKLEEEVNGLPDIDLTLYGFNLTDAANYVEKIQEGGEINLEDFSDDKFKYHCPHCGFSFNKGGKKKHGET